jgi:hypothetical protein
MVFPLKQKGFPVKERRTVVSFRTNEEVRQMGASPISSETEWVKSALTGSYGTSILI